MYDQIISNPFLIVPKLATLVASKSSIDLVLDVFSQMLVPEAIHGSIMAWVTPVRPSSFVTNCCVDGSCDLN